MKRLSIHSWLLRATLPALLAASVGCGDEYLDDVSKPQGTLNDQSLANATGVEASLIAAYRALDWNNGVGGNWGNSASNWVWGSVASDDAYKGSEPTDQPNINDVEAYQWTTGLTENYLNEKWLGAYEGVVRANATLRLLRTVAGMSGQLTAADTMSIRGEAVFLRAHYHFEAWRMWGRVPYYREDDTDFRQPNADSATVVANILQDLDSAIYYLPETSRKGQVGRVHKWTAKAYKGRVLAYAAQWPAALAALREVRASGPYALEASFDRVWTGFASLQNGKETILAYQASSNDGEVNGNNANYGERLNFPHSGSPFGCCGFHQASQNLVNFYRVTAAGLPIATEDTPATAAWNANDAEFDADATNRPVAVDPRLDWTVGRDSVPYKDWGPHLDGWIRSPAYGGPYSGKKVAYEKASGAAQTGGGWAPAQQSSMNIHIFRYADLLLLLAEAEVEAGTLENARTIVNEIRTRAAARAQGPGTSATDMAVPLNDPSITWATYRIGTYGTPFANQAAARAAVRTERRLELAMEGQRFFDLRRWGTYQTVLNAYLDKEGTTARRPYLASAARLEPRHRWYPIPNIQIELSVTGGEERLTQNPGW